MKGPSRSVIGTAGWGIPRAVRDRFAETGTHLERYARTLPCVEINSSFYRPHAARTYEKWAAATPDSFQFAVKVPRLITHELALRRCTGPLAEFLAATDGLGAKRGPLLVQLPASQPFDRRVVDRFFALFRARYSGTIVCEPRHPAWFSSGADTVLVAHRVARVAADPTLVSDADTPGGWLGFMYYRLHGSPRKYWSPYSTRYLDALAKVLGDVRSTAETWCIFDNTASGAAAENALDLKSRLDALSRDAARDRPQRSR